MILKLLYDNIKGAMASTMFRITWLATFSVKVIYCGYIKTNSNALLDNNSPATAARLYNSMQSVTKI